MHAVVVQVTVNDRDAAIENLRSNVVPGISGLPGFVSGYWVALPGNKGASIAAFESEQAAQQAAEQVSARGEEVTVETVEVGEVVANA